MIDHTELIYNGASGLVGALLGALGSFFGLNVRLGKAEKAIEELSKTVVFTDTCIKCQKLWDTQFQISIKDREEIHKKIDLVIDRQLLTLMRLGIDPTKPY